MRRITSLSKYENLFAPAGNARFAGDASVLHLYSVGAAERIYQYDPDAKILIFLRDQEYFLPSLHHHFLYRYVESIEDFETAWRLSGNRPLETVPQHCRDPKMLDYAAWGDFRTMVSRYIERFPRKQVLVIDYDSWTADPRAAYLQILEFLGLDDDGRRDFPRINEAKAHRFKWLGRLTAQPPALVEAPFRLVRKLTGRHRLGIGVQASKILDARGYRTHVSPELREEIRLYYREGNRKLKQLLAGRNPGEAP